MAATTGFIQDILTSNLPPLSVPLVSSGCPKHTAAMSVAQVCELLVIGKPSAVQSQIDPLTVAQLP